MTNVTSAYNHYYDARQESHVYPVEFVVRTLLGQYKLPIDKSKFRGSRILDLGYGDGRNMPLLSNLGFKVYGIEITETINQLAKKRLSDLNILAELKVGHNTNIPYADEFFQYVLACHACYYVNEGESFNDNIKEISRVLAPDGIFICSLPKDDTYILNGAEQLPDRHFRIKNDPYNLRNGVIFRAFARQEEIKEVLGAYFTDFAIGYCDDDFYGVEQKVWIVTCKKA